jgi:death-on-curing protein
VKTHRWTWIPLDAVLAIHDEQISEHGGIPGAHDLSGIELALARPRNLLAYGKPDAAALAAAYAFGLCRNHGFFDGNKRTAWVIAETFLDLNGNAVRASDESVVRTVLAVAAGAMPEKKLAEWLRSVIAPPEDPLLT